MTEIHRIARAYENLEEQAAARWDLANRGNQAILAERRRITRALLEDAGLVPLAGRRVLEVGSGNGGELAWLCELGASPSLMVGVDLLAHRVVAARRAFPGIDFQQANAERLDFPGDEFDLVLAITVFSSIFDRRMAGNVASEVVRVLRPGGALLWYDVRYDSVSNRNVRAVTAARVRELFPSLQGELRTLTLLPPLTRRLGRFTDAGYPVLSRFGPLRSHLIGLLRKPRGA
jgi:ubiquinone/menaquinone biosynthesis C-methylase UbiE